MASQKVHNVSYLTATTLDLKESTTQATLLPKGAHITHLSVEVLEAAEAGAKLDLGFEGQGDALANDIDTSTKGVNICNVAFSPAQDSILLASSSGANSGSAILRVGYFLPSTIAIEY